MYEWKMRFLTIVIFDGEGSGKKQMSGSKWTTITACSNERLVSK